MGEVRDRPMILSARVTRQAGTIRPTRRTAGAAAASFSPTLRLFVANSSVRPVADEIVASVARAGGVVPAPGKFPADKIIGRPPTPPTPRIPFGTCVPSQNEFGAYHAMLPPAAHTLAHA